MADEIDVPKLRAKALVEAVSAYAMAQAEIERTKPIILDHMGQRPIAAVGNHRVKVSHITAVPGVPAVMITTEMVGRTIPAKKARGASVRLTVS